MAKCYHISILVRPKAIFSSTPLTSIAFEYVAGILGASPDERKDIFSLWTISSYFATVADANELLVKLITSFLLSYPLAGLLKRVPDEKPALKNLFIIRFAIPAAGK